MAKNRQDDLGLDNENDAAHTTEIIDEYGTTVEAMPEDTVSVNEYMLVKTLTLVTMGSAGTIARDSHERVRVARIWGRVDSWNQVAADPGQADSVMLDVVVGIFRGLNCQNGTRYQAPVLALPAAFQPVLVNEISTNGKPFEFQIEIIAQPAGNPSGYSYVSRIYMDTQSPDPLAEMEQRFKIGRGPGTPLIPLRSDARETADPELSQWPAIA